MIQECFVERVFPFRFFVWMSFGTFNGCKASFLDSLMQLVLGYMEDLLILDVNFKLRKFVFFVSVGWLESGAFDFTSVVSCLAYFLWKALKWAVLARYLAELLTERQKLSPFMLVLPHSYRLLNQGEFLFLMEINFFLNLLYDGLKSTTSVVRIISCHINCLLCFLIPVLASQFCMLSSASPR